MGEDKIEEEGVEYWMLPEAAELHKALELIGKRLAASGKWLRLGIQADGGTIRAILEDDQECEMVCHEFGMLWRETLPPQMVIGEDAN
jgi:hypothetical protein